MFALPFLPVHNIFSAGISVPSRHYLPPEIYHPFPVTKIFPAGNYRFLPVKMSCFSFFFVPVLRVYHRYFRIFQRLLPSRQPVYQVKRNHISHPFPSQTERLVYKNKYTPEHHHHVHPPHSQPCHMISTRLAGFQTMSEAFRNLAMLIVSILWMRFLFPGMK